MSIIKELIKVESLKPVIYLTLDWFRRSHKEDKNFLNSDHVLNWFAYSRLLNFNMRGYEVWNRFIDEHAKGNIDKHEMNSLREVIKVFEKSLFFGNDVSFGLLENIPEQVILNLAKGKSARNVKELDKKLDALERLYK